MAQNIKFVNEENEEVGMFLMNTLDGRKIFSNSNSSCQLEYLVRQYHKNHTIPNWNFADNYDEGIEWVCFGDLFNNLKNYVI